MLTDRAGRFEIAYDDQAFQLRDQEKRSDLVLIVFAPEDATDPARRTSAPQRGGS